MVFQEKHIYEIVDNIRNGNMVQFPQKCKHVQSFPDCQLVYESVKLWTVANQWLGSTGVIGYIYALDEDLSSWRFKGTRHHFEGGGLPCPIDAQQSKTFPLDLMGKFER